jgi:hypothetical protein
MCILITTRNSYGWWQLSRQGGRSYHLLEGRELFPDQRTRSAVAGKDGSRSMLWTFISHLSTPSLVDLKKLTSFVNHSWSSVKCNSTACLPRKLLSNELKLLEHLIKSLEKWLLLVFLSHLVAWLSFCEQCNESRSYVPFAPVNLAFFQLIRSINKICCWFYFWTFSQFYPVFSITFSFL